MKLLPARTMTALAALVDIATHTTTTRPVSAKEMAARIKIGARYLEPTLQVFVHEGILQAFRGPRGGYALARGTTPGDISLKTVIDVVDSLSVVGDPAALLTGEAQRIAKTINSAAAPFVSKLRLLSLADLMTGEQATSKAA